MIFFFSYIREKIWPLNHNNIIIIHIWISCLSLSHFTQYNDMHHYYHCILRISNSNIWVFFISFLGSFATDWYLSACPRFDERVCTFGNYGRKSTVSMAHDTKWAMRLPWTSVCPVKIERCSGKTIGINLLIISISSNAV